MLCIFIFNRMKKHILILFISTFSLLSIAQNPDTASTDTASTDTASTVPKNWTTGGLISLDFAQSSFTNWAAGGQNALSITSIFNTFANYKKGKNSWDNSIGLAYGMLQSGHSALQKNEDKIDLSSKYGRYALDHWYYSALLNFKS